MNPTLGSLLQGVGISVGIVAGTIVTLIVTWFTQKNKEQETLRYLNFEIDLNIGKIDRWLSLINDYRNAVNSDSLDRYSGYFDLSSVVTTFYYNTFFSGLLYKYLSFEDINQLQVIFSEFSQSWQTLLNQEIANNKEIFMNNRKKYDKSAVAFQVNYWENKFKAHKKTLEEIKKRFEKSKSNS